MLPVPGKRDFADMLKLRLLRWGDYPALSGWTQCNQKGPYVRRQEESERRPCDSDIGVMHFEDGERGHKPRNTGGHYELVRAKKGFSPRASRRILQPH